MYRMNYKVESCGYFGMILIFFKLWPIQSNPFLDGLCFLDKVLVTFVYAKCAYVERRALWHELEERCMEDQSWLVLGDFNVIRADSKRIGGHPWPLISMAEFNECIDRCGLLDLFCSGQRMSWCNGNIGLSRSWAKLDRVLINNSFLARFQSAQFKYLSRKSSDHCPMVVYSNNLFSSYGPSPF